MNFSLQGSPFDTNENEYSDEIDKKKQQRKNKTIKRNTNTNSGRTISNNARNMIGNIHSQVDVDSDGDSGQLEDFNPPPHGEVQYKKSNINNEPPSTYNNTLSIKSDDSNNDKPIHNVEAFNNLQTEYEHNNSNNNINPYNNSNTYTGPNNYSGHYNQSLPYYTQMSKPSGNKDQLLEKLNYMIHLLEEQQDEKTGHVMEELILYSFLGVFIIFIVDSFARAGKYTR